MPKRLEEINYFRSGIVYTRDDRDIPNDAASYSLNVDPQLDNGSIKGIPTDDSIEEGVNSIGMEIITDGATKRLVYMDSDGDIHKVDDVEASNPDNEVELEAGTYTNPPAMVVNNKEVHIGLGDSRDSKWVGIIPHGQFGGSIPSGLQIENAELSNPSDFPDMHKVVTDHSHIYGIEYGKNSIYKFGLTSYALTKTKKPVYTTLAEFTALALASDGDLWVLDSSTYSTGSKILGTLYKIDSETLEVKQENKLSIASVISTNYYTDLLEAGAQLWVSSHKENLTSGHEDDAYLVNMTTPTANGDTTVVNRMLFLKTDTAGSPAVGTFDTASSDNGLSMSFWIPKINLVAPKSSSTLVHVGLACEIVDRDSSSSVAKFVYTGGSTRNVKGAFLITHKDATGGTSTPTGDNGLVYLQAVGSPVPMWYESSSETEGFCHSDGISYWYFGRPHATDTNDVTIYRDDILDVDSYSNGDSLTAYQNLKTLDLGSQDVAGTGAAITTHIKNAERNLHIFSSGLSVGRWTEMANVQVNFASGNTPTVKLQSDAYVGLSLSSATGTASGFTADKVYYYKLSYVYDGYQESPLTGDFNIAQGGTVKNISVVINLLNTATISKRISAVNVYMAEGDANSNNPLGFYRLVKTVSLNDQWISTNDDTTAPDWGVRKTHSFLHKGNIGASYESRTGISEALTNFTPKYKFSTDLNNHHFVAKCSHPDLDNAALYLFKSRPYNYDQFNWAYDFLVLPQQPTAIKGFNGRIYAFTTSRFYKIEPNNMYIEDTYEGAGCLSNQSVIVTDDGMFFADDRNIYHHNGTTLTPLANAILQFDANVEASPISGSSHFGRYGTAWQNRVGSTENVVLGYDNKRRTLLVFFDIAYNYGGTDYTFNFCWAYTINQKRWDLWEAPIVKSYVSGTDGQNFISNGTDLYDYLGGGSTRSWQWYSKKITMNASTVDKKFIKMHEESDTGTPTVTVATNDAPTTYASLSAIRKAKWIRIKAVAASSTDRLNSVGIQWRQLRETPITDP